MLLETNTVYISSDEYSGEAFRIVEAFDAVVFCIDLTKKYCMPYSISRSALESLIESGHYIQGKEPFVVGSSEELLSEKDKAIRDRKYAAVSRLMQNRFSALDKHERSQMIRDIAAEKGVHPVQLRRDFSRYLQRGMTQSALLPDNYLKGARGKQKNVSDTKRGRPVWVNTHRGAGVNVGPDIQKKIEKVISSYYLHVKERSYTKSYKVFLDTYYSDRHYVNGNLVIQNYPEYMVPSENQFYYHARNFVDSHKVKSMMKRFGSGRFNRTYRALLGDTSKGNFGPGYRYEIDATHSRVYVVSSINEWVCVGEAIIYIIIDVFSRMVMSGELSVSSTNAK